MKIGFGRYRLRIALRERSGNSCVNRVMDGERTDRDQALIAQAENDFRDSKGRQFSILSGVRD